MKATAIRDSQSPSNFLLWATIIFLILEYARPLAISELKIQMVLIICFSIIGIAKFKAWKNPLSAIHLVMFMLICSAIAWATNLFSVYTGARVMFGIITLSIMLVIILQNSLQAKVLIRAWVYILAYCGVYGILHDGRGPGGFIGDENDLAVACVIGLAFSISNAREFSGRHRISYALLSLLFVAGIVSTHSRGGFVAAIITIGFMWFTTKGLGKKILWPIAALIGFLLFAPAEYRSEVFSIRGDISETQDQYSTALQRKFLWVTGVNMFKANPILGVGTENYPWRVGEYQPTSGDWPKAFLVRDRSTQAAHSMYVQLLSEQGSAGVLLFAMILYYFKKNISNVINKAKNVNNPELGKELRAYSFGIMGALLGVLCAGTFLSTLYYPHFWYLTAMSVGLARMNIAEDEMLKNKS